MRCDDHGVRACGILAGEANVIVAIPEALREVLGPEGARALAELLNRVGHDMRDDVIAITEERFQRHLAEELAGLREAMARMEAGIREEMARMESGIREEMARMESGIRKDMAKLESGIREDLARMESGLRKDMVGMESGLQGNIARVESSLEARLGDRMNRLETRLLRWSFGFWVTQFAALLAVFYTLFTYFRPDARTGADHRKSM